MTNQIIFKFKSEENACNFIAEARKTKLLSNNTYAMQRIKLKIVQIQFNESVAEVDLSALIKLGNKYSMVIYEY